jgi:hypothetical protein
VEDISIYKSQVAKQQHKRIELGGSPQSSIASSSPGCFSVYPSLHQLFSTAERVLSNRRELYSTLAVERLGGFMTTYFLTIPDPGQPYPFFYTFPYGHDDMLKSKQRKGSVKVKRRSPHPPTLPHSCRQMVCVGCLHIDILQVEVPETHQRSHSNRPINSSLSHFAILPATHSFPHK